VWGERCVLGGGGGGGGVRGVQLSPFYLPRYSTTPMTDESFIRALLKEKGCFNSQLQLKF